MAELSSDRDPVEELAEEFLERHRRGERPALSEYTRRHPELADAIRELFPALVKIEQFKPGGHDLSPSGRTQNPLAPEPPLKRLGDYRILREVGRGGMGVVYEAEQESLGRHVALKVLPSHALLDPKHLERFRREARAAARLHHTNIVPVFGVGEQDGLHYYVMQFIHGLGLDVVLDELRRLRQPQDKRTPTLDDALGRQADGTRDLSAVHVARSLLSGQFRTPQPVGAVTVAPGEAPAAANNPPALTQPDSSSVRPADSS